MDSVWFFQIQADEGEWSEPVETDGPETFSLIGDLYDSIVRMEITCADGSTLRYNKKIPSSERR